METLHLYGHPDSGHAYKIALALSLGGIPYRYSYVDIWAPRESRPASFKAASKWHEVPCVIFSDGAMIQSGAILARIAVEFDVFGGNASLPRALEWIYWDANRLGMAIPQLIAAKQAPETFSAGTVRWLKQRFETDIARLEAGLEDRPFLLGDALSIADIALFGYTNWHDRAGVEVPENTARWLDRIRALEGFQTADALLGRDQATKEDE